MAEYHHFNLQDTLKYTHVKGRRVLVVGCGRGLECKLFLDSGAKEVVGIDISDVIGADYNYTGISYLKCSADSIPLDDESFEVVVSYATLEHVQKPEAVLREMIRLASPRGIIYCSAAPLWNSPHGHHKKNCFLDEPWIHLRYKSMDLMCNYFADSLDKVIDGAPLRNHINYIFNKEAFNRYSAKDFKRIISNVLLLNINPINIEFAMHYTFDSLLTPYIKKLLSEYEEDELFTETIKMIFRKI